MPGQRLCWPKHSGSEVNMTLQALNKNPNFFCYSSMSGIDLPRLCLFYSILIKRVAVRLLPGQWTHTIKIFYLFQSCFSAVLEKHEPDVVVFITPWW